MSKKTIVSLLDNGEIRHQFISNMGMSDTIKNSMVD